MSASPVRILVVDDEPPIRRLLRAALATQGYETIEAESGREAQLRAAAKPPPDLIVLDLGLPDLEGHDLLRQWRETGVAIPILILSSRADEPGIVQALELGADDDVVKPFGAKELLARIRVALHRLQSQGTQATFQVGDLSVDLVRRIVRVRGEEVKLTPREYEILAVMIQHAGKALIHDFLMRQVWGASIDVQNLRVHVRQLRQKIEADPERPYFILTETGVGYRLRAPEQ